MRASDQDIYQGLFLINARKQLDDLHYLKELSFETGTSKNSFIININNDETLGIYLKYTKKNTSPWTFNFKYEHQEEIDILKEICSDVLIGFVCGLDGVCLIKYRNFKEILDDYFEESEAVSIRRKPGGNYWLKGRDGKLEKSIPANNIGKLLIDSLNI